MSYTIKKSDGTTLATVPENDIVLDAASVALIGRGATNYGAAHSEAFVHILENFANATAPAHPMKGQMWFDTTIAAMKVYDGAAWGILGAGGGGGGGGGGGSGDTVGGPIYVPITTGGIDTSVLVMVAGGQVVAVVSPRDIPNGDIPVSVTVLNQTIPLRARFPAGFQGGVTLATDVSDYLWEGHQKHADAADYVGGGTPFGATTFVDLGSATVTLSISNGAIIAAFSQVVRASGTLPSNISVGGNTIPFAAAFPNGLKAGLTLAAGFEIGIGSGTIGGDGDIGGGVTIEVVAEMIGEETQARATALTEIYAYADETYAQAGLVNTMNATFTSATGQTSLADAINWIVATAGSGTSDAQAITDLKAEVSNAITGSTSFAHALTILNAKVAEDAASAEDLTELDAALKSDVYDMVGKAINRLSTNALGMPKQTAEAISTINITLSGEQTLNGFTTSASRVLVARQTNKAQNGIYVTGSGAWTRATDADSWLELVNGFVLITAGSQRGTAWLMKGASIGTVGTTELTVQQVETNTVISEWWTALNAEFETDTGYESLADAVNDLKVLASGDGGATAAFDTDLRTRFTNALQAGSAAGTINTIQDAMGKLSTYSGLITTNKTDFDNLINLFKTLTGTGVNESTATAINKLVSQSFLTGALASFSTSLKTEFIQDMNEVTGGTGTTFSQAITDVIASSSSDGSGSTSTVDTALRNIFISTTNEAGFPVTTISEAVQKLMNNTTKDRALSTQVTELQSIFTNGLGTTLANATSKLSTVATQASSASTAVTTLNNTLITETGKSSVAAALDYLATQADLAGSTSTKVTSIESAFTTATGQSNVTSAIQTMWTAANSTGGTVGYSLTLNNNGYVTGVQLVNGGSAKSYFRVAADKFIVSDPNDTSPTPMFEVVGGAAYIKGEKIQSGTVTSVKYASVTYAFGTNMDSWTPNIEVIFPAGSVPANSRALINFNCTAKQTGSDNDTKYFYCERYAWSGTAMGWADLPNQRAMFSFTDGTGMSQSWTYVDDNITNAMIAHEIRYRPRMQDVEGDGDLRHFTITGLMCKK